MTDTLMRLMRLQARGYPCSMMMMLMALEEQDRRNPALVRSMAGLANGIGDFSGSCGALTAGACIISLNAGDGEGSEYDKDRLLPMLELLNEWFTERTAGYGGCLCHEITDNRAGAPDMAQRCGQLIADTYDRVMEILVENGIDPCEAKDE